jgi:hypothetical protein
MPLDLPIIGTARQAHGAISPADYRQRQAVFIARNELKRPDLRFGQPHDDASALVARISGGWWIVDCGSCGNCPSTDPDWAIACCFECGAVYVGVIFPDNRIELEAALLVRPMKYRHWAPPETVENLQAENLLRGIV